MATIGPDWASVDKNISVNLMQARSAGARFAIVRAIYGRSVHPGDNTPYRDPEWMKYRDAITVANLRRSAYLFICYPKTGVETPTPEAQAQAFIDYVQLEPFKDMVPMIDVEQASDMLNAEGIYAWTLRIAKALRAHYGAWPGIYTSARVWSEDLDHHSPGPLLNCPLWLAKPWPWPIRSPVHLDGAPGYAPIPIPEFGNQYWIYQYQGDALGWPGFTSTCDANRFRVIGEGAKGAHVVWAQQRLGITADGIFGPKTKEAVKALQAKHHLAVDGIIGVNTFAPLCWSNPAP